MPSRPSLRRALALCPWLIVPGAPVALAQQLGPPERARLAASVWAEVRYNGALWDRVRADWDSAFTALLDGAPRRQSDVAFFRELRRFVALLPDGRAAVVPPAAVGARWGRPPLVLRAVERRPFLVDYAENDEMRVARPERNAEILAVQGIPAERWIRDSVLPEIAASTEQARWAQAVAHMLDGERGTAIHLQLRLPGGEERGASVTRSVPLTERWPFAPPPLQVDTLPDRVAWVRLSSLADPDVARDFDRAFADFRGVRGVILDLRDCEGTGAGRGREAGYRILGRVVPQPLVTARRRTPQYRPGETTGEEHEPESPEPGVWHEDPPDTVPPRTDLPVFAGPVALLTSSWTGGSGEDVALAFREAGRGPIVGQTTSGSAGLTVELRLYRGWRLRLTRTRDAFPDGAEIQGRGIAPEVPVAVKVPDVLAGRDAALDRAREYIARRTTAGP